jgi:hypothetical protein
MTQGVTYRIDRMEIPSFGECIYCGALASDVELTDEHVIPLSLGGKVVILDGSCKTCAKETSKLENEIAHKVLWEFRAHVKAPTRRKKRRPTELPFTYSIAGGEKQTKTVPIADHPFFTPMPVWGRPGLLLGKEPAIDFEHYKAHVFYSIPPNIKQTLDLEDGVPAEIPFPEFRINHQFYARGLAKIAYCDAVGRFGLHEFRSLAMQDLILGRYPCIPYFVGCRLDDPPPPTARDVAHVITVGPETVNGIKLLVSSIRLFANSGVEEHGPPVYEVIIGAPGIGAL